MGMGFRGPSGFVFGLQIGRGGGAMVVDFREPSGLVLGLEISGLP